MFWKMKPDNRNKDIGQALSLLTCLLETDLEQRKIELEWFKSHYDLATKQDLRKAEARIISAIESDCRISESDKKILEALLEKLIRITEKLTAIDQSTAS